MNEELISQLKLPAHLNGFFDGLEVGNESAEYRTIREFTLRLTRYRCGDLPQELEDLIFALPDETIYALAEGLFDFSSQEDLCAWLQAQMTNPRVWRYVQPHSTRVFGQG